MREAWVRDGQRLLPPSAPPLATASLNLAPDISKSSCTPVKASSTLNYLPKNVPVPRYFRPQWAEKHDMNDDVIRFDWDEDEPFALAGPRSQLKCGLETTVFAAYPFLSFFAWIYMMDLKTGDTDTKTYLEACIHFCDISLENDLKAKQSGETRTERDIPLKVMRIFRSIKEEVKIIYHDNIIFQGGIKGFQFDEERDELLICGCSEELSFTKWFDSSYLPKVVSLQKDSSSESQDWQGVE